MGPLGFPELMIIFFLALIVFGPRKLPELGRSLGKSLSEFKRASNELRSTLDEEIRLEDRRAAATPIPSTTSGSTPTELEYLPTEMSEDPLPQPQPQEQQEHTVARGDAQA